MPRRRKFKSEEDKFLSRDAVRRLLMGPYDAGSLRDYYLLSVMYYLALRSTEAVAMRPEFFDWRNRSVLIPTAKRKLKAGQISTSDKGGDRPLIRIPMLFGEAVLRGAASWAAENGSDGGWMFPSRSLPGVHILERQVRETFHRWSKAAGISDEVSSHSLRHSAGTHVYEMAGSGIRKSGGDPVVLIRDFMRHSDISITSIYLHSADGTIEAARKALSGNKQ